MKIIKAHCNVCGGGRRQEVLREEVSDWNDDESGISSSASYEMIKCCGCEGISLRHSSWCSEDLDNSGDPVETIRYYPPETFRQEPSWLWELSCACSPGDRSVEELVHEIYVALQNDSLRLAAMGIRALVEHVMHEKIGDQGTFRENLNKFELEGFISKSQREVLEPVLEAGHATIHRSYKPSKLDLVALIDITENILESIYINQLRASQIKGKVPPRIRKQLER